MLYGLSSLLSFSFAIEPAAITLFVLVILSMLGSSSVKKFLLLWSVNFTVILFGASHYQLPQIPAEGVPGTLYFRISSSSTSETHFGRQNIYLGYGKCFIPDNFDNGPIMGKNFPCSVSVPIGKNIQLPPADKDYVIKGVLKKSNGGNFFLKVDKATPWLPVENSWSLAEWRSQQKQKLKAFLYNYIPEHRSAEFLAGIITGQFEDRVMRSEFGRLGLQHLMAISGFHFALLAGIFAFFLRLFLPQKITVGVLILLMTSYCAFLGASPSILRAWMMGMVTLGGLIVEKRPLAMNALGVAFLFILFYDPLLIRSIGFQFSAAVTASLLVFYPASKKMLQNLITLRPLSLMRKMSLFDQHCYCIISILREGLALAIAVNIIAVPMTLYYFHKFPLLSLLYNLFIPFLVSCAMFFLTLAAVAFVLIPQVGAILFKFTGGFTHFMLNFIYNTPAPLNINWHMNDLPLSSLILYLAIVFSLGIMIREYNEKDHKHEPHFMV